MVKRCPNHHRMSLRVLKKNASFRGLTIDFTITVYVCEQCNIELADMKQSEKIQQTISESYRKKVGLLTVEKMDLLRKMKGFTLRELSMESGILESRILKILVGAIQTEDEDNLLRNCFWPVFNSKEFAKKTKVVRKILRLSQTDFGKLFFVSGSVINKWENGRNNRLPNTSQIEMMNLFHRRRFRLKSQFSGQKINFQIKENMMLTLLNTMITLCIDNEV